MIIPPLGAILGYGFFILLILNFLICVFSILSKKHSNVHIVQSINIGIFFLFLGSIIHLSLLIANNAFEYKLVYETANLAMPLHQKLSGLWANQNSSLNFWCFLLTGANLINHRISSKIYPQKDILISNAIFIFLIIIFLFPVEFIMNPFEKFWLIESGTVQFSVWVPNNAQLLSPENGIGLNPSLRHTAMLIHPPFLYVGLIGFFIPYVLSLVDIMNKTPNGKWKTNTFNISLFSWISLTIGMVLGSWWAYSISGWGGYWGWDAVEIAGLIPWLLSIGFVHSLTPKGKSVQISAWPYVFISLVFISILMGIFITRSGIIESVHAYASGPVGPVLSILLITFLFLSTTLVVLRRKQFKPSSQNFWVLISHYFLIILSLLYFLGQTYPITSMIVTGNRSLISANQFEVFSIPFILLILIAMYAFFFRMRTKNVSIIEIIKFGSSVIITLIDCYFLYREIPFRPISALLVSLILFLLVRFSIEIALEIFNILKRTKNLHKNQTPHLVKLGSLIVHAGFIILLLGVMGVENGSERFSASLAVGDVKHFGDQTIMNISSQQYYDSEPRLTNENVFHLYRGNQVIAKLSPEIHIYESTGIKTSKPSTYSTLLRDIQIVLTNWQGIRGISSVDILIFPLIAWIWIGSLLMIIGGFMILLNSANK